MDKKQIEQLIKDAIKKVKIKFTDEIVIQTPKDPRWGDYSTNIAMLLAKKIRKNPIELAKKIVKNIKVTNICINVVAPGFINFKIDNDSYIKELIKICQSPQVHAKEKIGKEKTIVIDYSSPNIAKPMSVGHLRSTIIGDALVRIFRYQGYKVIGDNHLGDWGTQFGKLLYAYKNWWKKGKKISINTMLDLYIKFHQEAKINPILEEKAREEFKKLEDKDPINRKIWYEFRNESIREFSKIYDILGVKFDKILGESFYEEMLPDIIQKALKNKTAKKSLGALVIDVGEDLPPLLLQKQDEATLYATRDLATIDYREKQYKPDEILYVIGNEQKLYLKQLFIASEKMHLTKARLVHIGFGMVRMKEGKMSTREGRIVYLSELIEKACKKAYEVVDKKNPNLDQKDKFEIANKIGIGAIKYNDLSQNRNTDIVFDYDKMLSLVGNSAPYIMYSYARAKSILRKAKRSEYKKISKNIDISTTKFNPSEEKLLKTLSKFDDAVDLSASKFQTNFLCEYLFKLANDFNFFYHNNPVISEKEEIKKMRLMIVFASSQVIKNGLKLLGIDVLEKM